LVRQSLAAGVGWLGEPLRTELVILLSDDTDEWTRVNLVRGRELSREAVVKLSRDPSRWVRTELLARTDVELGDDLPVSALLESEPGQEHVRDALEGLDDQARRVLAEGFTGTLGELRSVLEELA
jgi:hypothetical protein